jgi:hypothetical protein
MAIKNTEQLDGKMAKCRQADAGASGEKTAALDVVGLILEQRSEEARNLIRIVLVVASHDYQKVETFTAAVVDRGAKAAADAARGLVENRNAVSGKCSDAVIGRGVVDAKEAINEPGAQTGGHGTKFWAFIEKRKSGEDAVAGIERNGFGAGECADGRASKRLRRSGRRVGSFEVEDGRVHRIESKRGAYKIANLAAPG